MSTLVELPPEVIQLSPQMREKIDSQKVTALALTMAAVTLLSPARVRRTPDGYVSIDGAHRILAAIKLGWKTIKVEVVEGLSEADALHQGFVANTARVPLNPIEESNAIAALMEQKQWDVAGAVAQIGKSKSMISNILALRQLPSDIQELIKAGKIPASTAYELARVHDPAKQAALASEAAAGKTRAEIVRAIKASKPRGPKPNPIKRERVSASFGEGRSIAISGPEISLNKLIAWMDEFLSAARLAQSQGLAVSEFLKAFRNRTRG